MLTIFSGVERFKRLYTVKAIKNSFIGSFK